MSNKLFKIEKFKAGRFYNITNTSTLNSHGSNGSHSSKSFKISNKFLLSIIVIFLTALVVIFNNDANALNDANHNNNTANIANTTNTTDNPKSSDNSANVANTMKVVKADTAFNTGNAAQQLINILEKTTTYEALFTQKIKAAKQKRVDTTKGKMYSKKPNLFRWEVTSPSQNLIVSNGKNLWDYDKELEQVTVQTIKANDVNSTPFFLSGDMKKMQEDYSIALETCKMHNLATSELCFKLTPKKDDMSFQYLILGFKTDILREMVLFDQLGQTTGITFSNAIINKNINNSLFKLNIPKGVDVLKNS